MAVATLYAVTEGALLAHSGRRAELDPHDTRGLSYFQIGCRHIQRLLFQGRRLRLHLYLPPTPDPDPVSAPTVSRSVSLAPLPGSQPHTQPDADPCDAPPPPPATVL